MVYIGVDPGVNGGFGVVSAAGALLDFFPMPETERDLLDALRPFSAPDLGECPASQPRARAVLERAQASPQMGVVSAFTFGKGYGALRMALTVARIPFEDVGPVKWQNVMGCRTHGDKNISKRRAQQLFPLMKITHATADAILLAEFCRRLEIPTMAR